MHLTEGLSVMHRVRPDSRYWQKAKPRAREFRTEATRAEQLLWEQLRNRQLLGVKFRRQHPIGRFICDFCAPETSLVIELDGAIHQQRTQEDLVREEYLIERGFRVLRFENEEVLFDVPSVLEAISSHLAQHSALPEPE